jgi:putative PIN family toxin of toxin-antitoxin system
VVSASILKQSTSANAFDQAVDNGTILLSEVTSREIRDVIKREKFDRYASRKKRERFLSKLIRDAELVEPETQIRVCRDPDDDKYLEMAVDGGANCIVSRDKDLLVLNPFNNIPIMRPDQFLKWLPENED